MRSRPDASGPIATNDDGCRSGCRSEAEQRGSKQGTGSHQSECSTASRVGAQVQSPSTTCRTAAGQPQHSDRQRQRRVPSEALTGNQRAQRGGDSRRSVKSRTQRFAARCRVFSVHHCQRADAYGPAVRLTGVLTPP